MSCRAGSASASASPGRSRSTRASSSATKPSRRSTCRSRARSSTCSRTCSRSSGLTYLFIAHDLAVVRHISSKVAVMYLGRIVEYAPADELFANPQHPYTRALLAAAPVPDPVIERTRPRTIIKGELPSPLNPAQGLRLPPALPAGDGGMPQGRAGHSASLRPGIRSPVSTPETLMAIRGTPSEEEPDDATSNSLCRSCRRRPGAGGRRRRGADAQARRHAQLRRRRRAAELRLPRQHDVCPASTRSRRTTRCW